MRKENEKNYIANLPKEKREAFEKEWKALTTFVKMSAQKNGKDLSKINIVKKQ